MVNWKTGITRLYVVGWGLWVVVTGARTAVMISAGDDRLGMTLGLFAWVALVLPGGLLIALRWAIDGFVKPHRDD